MAEVAAGNFAADAERSLHARVQHQKGAFKDAVFVDLDVDDAARVCLENFGKKSGQSIQSHPEHELGNHFQLALRCI